MHLDYGVPIIVEICDILTTGAERLPAPFRAGMAFLFEALAKLSGRDPSGKMQVEELSQLGSTDPTHRRSYHMDVPLKREILSRIGVYLAGDTSFEQFQEWFVAATLGAYQSADPSLRDLIAEIKLRLAEFTGSDWTEDELREQLDIIASKHGLGLPAIFIQGAHVEGNTTSPGQARYSPFVRPDQKSGLGSVPVGSLAGSVRHRRTITGSLRIGTDRMMSHPA